MEIGNANNADAFIQLGIVMQTMLVQPFVSLIATTLGIHIRPSDQLTLWKKLLTRVKALSLPSPEAYYQLLDQSQSAPGRAEWRELANLITTTETYFFRDSGQFSLLRNYVLPELISRKRALATQSACRPQLRLWSAGCSTGEEAYSLAIVLDQLLSDRSQWDILILGTDVNHSTITRARQGIYSDWSFRAVAPEVQQDYFRRHWEGWEIAAPIRQMVKFRPGNLVQDGYPEVHAELHDLDLIICRNVFIYFEPQAIDQVLKKFYATLSPGGYLMTGHLELHGQAIDGFQVRSFPESALYQRPSQPAPAPILPVLTPPLTSPLPLPQPTLATIPVPSVGRTTLVSPPPTVAPQQTPQAAPEETAVILSLLSQKAYPAAILQIRQLLQEQPKHFQAYCWLAKAQANLADYSEAIQACEQAIALNPLASEPYYLLAQIAEERGDLEQAKTLLKRIIYLAPKSVFSYWELGQLYAAEGNRAKAEKLWRSAQALLNGMASEQPVEFQENLTVEDLRSWIKQSLLKP